MRRTRMVKSSLVTRWQSEFVYAAALRSAAHMRAACRPSPRATRSTVLPNTHSRALRIVPHFSLVCLTQV
jgi:hypothetical protein